MRTTRLTIAGGATVALAFIAGCSSTGDTTDAASDVQADASVAAEDIGEAIDEAEEQDEQEASDEEATDEGDTDEASGGSAGTDTASVNIDGELYNFAIPEDHDGFDAQCLALDGSLQGYLPAEGTDGDDAYFSFALVDWDAVTDAESHNPTSMSVALPDGTEWVAGEEATWFGLDDTQLPVEVVPLFDDAGSYASGTLTLQQVPDLAEPNADPVLTEATINISCLN